MRKRGPSWLQILRFFRASKPCAEFRFPGWCQVNRLLNFRIEDCCAGGMGDNPYPEIEDVHSSRIEDCEPVRIDDLRRIKLGWRKTKPSQKQGIRLKIYVMLRLTWAFRSQGIFECLPTSSPKNIIPYSVPHPTPL